MADLKALLVRVQSSAAAGRDTAAPDDSRLCDCLDREVIDELAQLDETGVLSLHRLVELFRSTSTALLADIERADLENDPNARTRAAHELKSSSRSLGAERLASLLEHIEHSRDQFVVNPEALRNGYAEALAALSSAAARSASATPSPSGDR